jgi:hypothetical protein
MFPKYGSRPYSTEKIGDTKNENLRDTHSYSVNDGCSYGHCFGRVIANLNTTSCY